MKHGRIRKLFLKVNNFTFIKIKGIQFLETLDKIPEKFFNLFELFLKYTKIMRKHILVKCISLLLKKFYKNLKFIKKLKSNSVRTIL